MLTTLLLVILGFCAGILGALTGIGGGVLLTPILALHFGIPIRQAIGTSLVAVITTSAASSSVHLQRHTTDIRLGMTLELATSFGAAIMAYLVGYFNRNALEGLFAAFLLYSAITILSKRGKVKAEDETAPRAEMARRGHLRLRAEALSPGTRRLAAPVRSPACSASAAAQSKFRSCPDLHGRAADGGDCDLKLHDRRYWRGQRHVYYRRGDILVQA